MKNNLHDEDFVDSSENECYGETENINNLSQEELLHNPYNEINREIEQYEIQNILTNYGLNVVINNIVLYRRAFVHKSYTKRPKLENQLYNINILDCPDNCLPLKTKSNERLEFLGDGVLELITKLYLYKRFPKADEGFMTEKKIALVKNEHIGHLAYNIGLHKYMIISKNAEEKKTRTNLKKLGCLFEAFIGAIFLDFNKLSIKDEHNWFSEIFNCGPGFQIAQLFVEKVFEQHVDWMKLINQDDNYKNQLQVIVQKEFKITPDYVELKYSHQEHENLENDNEKFYKMGLYISFGKNIHNVDINTAININKYANFKDIHKDLEINNELLIFVSYGENKIKKKAEQIASKYAIDILSKKMY
tara:strand:- start:745 stop:1827 length:1083 start_codon:yes stop_codon:yes gene_type:complete